jgi:hypothetical protein
VDLAVAAGGIGAEKAGNKATLLGQAKIFDNQSTSPALNLENLLT